MLRLAPLVVLLAFAFVPAYQKWREHEDLNGTCEDTACHVFISGPGMSAPRR